MKKIGFKPLFVRMLTKVSVVSALLLISAIGFSQEGTVTINQDPKLDQLLELKKSADVSSGVYKIQIYSGSRGVAERHQSQYKSNFEWSSKMVYETPNYKIWVGNFKTRLEADRALEKIKEKFSSAFIFKPKK